MNTVFNFLNPDKQSFKELNSMTIIFFYWDIVKNGFGSYLSQSTFLLPKMSDGF